MTYVPEHYRFPLTWFDPRGNFMRGAGGAIRYSALDVAESELGGAKLPAESARRLEERERRAQAHHRRLWQAQRILDRIWA